LFTGLDPESERYRSRAHLAEMINLLGPPPASLLTQGELRDRFFSSEGKQVSYFCNIFLVSESTNPMILGDFLAPDLLSDQIPLEKRETTLEGSVEREAFLRFMRKMLQWEPGNRSSAKELAEDEWIHSHM
jgi:serine/threonine-protein kinase SRPK3